MDRKEIIGALEQCGHTHERLLKLIERNPVIPSNADDLLTGFIRLVNAGSSWMVDPGRQTGDLLFVRAMTYATAVIDFLGVREESLAEARKVLVQAVAQGQADAARADGEVQ